MHPAYDSTRAGGARATLRLVSTVLVLTIACVVPSRALLALDQGRSIGARALYFAGGLVCDVAVVGPFVALLLVSGLAIARRLGSRRARATFGLAFVAVLATISLVHNAATLFRVERGVFPGPIDAREGLGALDSWTSQLPSIVAGRFFVANVLALGTVVHVVRKTCPGFVAGDRRARPWMLAAGFVVVFGALALVSANANAYCAGLHNHDAIVSPAASWLPGLLGRPRVDGAPADTRRLVASAPGGLEDVAEGARALGFSPATAERLLAAEAHPRCEDHPLRRSLDDDDGAVTRAARDLSAALFDGRSIDPVVFHVSLESFRADDVAALEPAAPREVAPYLSRLYEDPDHAAAFRFAHQSGIRTAHALGAVECGVGILPFHLAFGRDLGVVPFRCLPDVLGDAAFARRIVYGHELAFDDMGTFLKHHGMTLHERDDLPAEAPRGVWGGVSDGAVYDAALALAAADKGASYNFILTLSHHTPYTAPQDLAPALGAAIDRVCAERGLHGENCDRLRTARYADASLERFVAAIERSPLASRAIVVVAADHTTHQWVPWTGAEKADGITRIPAAIVLPRALRDGVVDGPRFGAAWARFREVARTVPVSNTDVPALVLALLASSRPLAALAPSARWHTLGGQATSPSFAPPVGDGALFGVDAHARLFTVGPRGDTRPTGIATDTLRAREDVLSPRPHDKAMLAFLGAFLRGYGAKCPLPPPR